jgi:leader peptidase (prepilin peptidase) / N-methyltransferase
MWQIRGVTSPLAMDVLTVCFGLIIGSFLNVCITRIPEGKSIVLPPSACPKCHVRIRPYDNVPVASWVLLRGRCRHCKAVISPMYPIVELLTAGLFWGCYRTFGLTLESLKWAVFSAILIVLFFTDLRDRMLPDRVNYTGLGVALALSLAVSPGDGTAAWLADHGLDASPPTSVLSVADAGFGAALGGGLLWLVSELYFRFRGREGMGLGDIKMMLMAGAFLGPKRGLLMVLVGSLLGSVLGLLVIAFLYLGGWKKSVAKRANRRGLGPLARLQFALVRRYQLPFGSYLAVAGIAVMFWGSPVVDWYESMLRVR